MAIRMSDEEARARSRYLAAVRELDSFLNTEPLPANVTPDRPLDRDAYKRAIAEVDQAKKNFEELFFPELRR